MFNRTILIILCTLSLSWIFFVGYDVFYKTDRLNPELIFSEKDEELLIINRTDEFFNVEIPFTILPEIAELTTKFIETPRNERIFLSKTQPIILIESPHYWNKNSVINYLKRKEITYKLADKAIFIGDLKVSFKYHFLLITSKDFVKNKTEFSIPAWDKKATAVVVHHVADNPYLTEIYTQENGQIIYQTTFDSRLKSQKTDDKNVFAPYLPADISAYHFYEKEYALENNILSSKSPMTDWIQYGFVVFNYHGNNAIISDCKVGEDALNTLNTRFGKDTLTFRENTLIQNIKLTENFPSDTKRGFYMTRIGDKTIFSENLDINKKILADYELGNTLLLNEDKARAIYGNLPYKVSERYISNTDYYAVSTYQNILTKYTIQANGMSKIVASETENKQDVQPFIVPISGTIVQVLGKGNQQYFVTSNHQLVVINNGKIVWKSDLGDALIGEVKLIDFEGTGKNHLLFNTAKKAFVLTEQGQNIIENQVLPKVEFLNEVNFYRWKNNAHLIYSDEKGFIRDFWTEKKSISTVTSNVNNKKKIEVFAQNNRIIGLNTNNVNTETIDLDKRKVLKKYPIIPADALRYKANGNVYFVHYQENELMKLDYMSVKTSLGKYQDMRQLKLSTIDNKNYISFVSASKLYVLDENGTVLKTVALAVSDLQDYDIIFVGNTLYTVLLDGLENKIVVTDASGNILRNNLEGKRLVFASVSKGSLNIISEGNGYVVQYYDVLKTN